MKFIRPGVIGDGSLGLVRQECVAVSAPVHFSVLGMLRVLCIFQKRARLKHAAHSVDNATSGNFKRSAASCHARAS